MKIVLLDILFLEFMLNLWKPRIYLGSNDIKCVKLERGVYLYKVAVHQDMLTYIYFINLNSS